MPTATISEVKCHHCGLETAPLIEDDLGQHYCCNGCRAVHRLLQETGVGPAQPNNQEIRTDLNFLEIPEVRESLIEYEDDEQIQITLRIPEIHCAACIYLFEAFPKNYDGINAVRVHFSKKLATFTFEKHKFTIAQIAQLVQGCGYVIDFNFDRHKSNQKDGKRNPLLLKMGVAGFCFGNIMLFSFPEYLANVPAELGPFQQVFSFLNAVLSFPVILFAAQPYWRGAWRSFQLKYLTIDVPIAIGIVALFVKSWSDYLLGIGPGYFDSFAGLIFFLLVGKWFQGFTYDAIQFDRDFKSFFPMAVNVVSEKETKQVLIEKLKVGDTIQLRNEDIVPADCRLVSGPSSFDFSFITGEQLPLLKQKEETIYTGGRLKSGSALLEVIAPAKEGYLKRLWSANSAETQDENTQWLTDKIAKNFTIAILSIATIATIYWLMTDPSIAMHVFITVLVIACPCALALAAPFTHGNVSRILGKHGIFIKSVNVIEKLAQLTHLVFDKTGTVTQAAGAEIIWDGAELSSEQALAIKSICQGSSHPISQAIAGSIETDEVIATNDFTEIKGKGLAATVNGVKYQIGSASFVGATNTIKPTGAFLAINDRVFGHFAYRPLLRPQVAETFEALQNGYQLHLVSGDNKQAKDAMQAVFGKSAQLNFNQLPWEKKNYVEQLHCTGHTAMIGDGLNDIEALKAADVGIVITENVHGFNPAGDLIINGEHLHKLPELLRYSKFAMRVIHICIGLSLAYNLVGLFFAVQGKLTPIIAAILMPISSVSIVAITLLLTTIGANRILK